MKRQAESSSVVISDDAASSVTIDCTERNMFVVKPTLVEVHSVTIFIKQPHGNKRGATEVYGTFRVDDACGVLELYNQDKENSRRIYPDRRLPLTSLSRCIVGSDHFLFTVCLKDKDRDLDLGNGTFLMNYYWEGDRCYYDRPLSAVFDGKDGYTMVHFTVFKKAVQADIEVTLLNDNKLVGAHQSVGHAVYGCIVSRVGKFECASAHEKKYFSTTLFDAPENEPAKLEPGDNTIPLLKHVVAVPYDSSLEIDASLWATTSNTPVEVADHILTFEPALSGYYVMSINGVISVKVSWHTPDPLKALGLY